MVTLNDDASFVIGKTLRPLGSSKIAYQFNRIDAATYPEISKNAWISNAEIFGERIEYAAIKTEGYYFTLKARINGTEYIMIYSENGTASFLNSKYVDLFQYL